MNAFSEVLARIAAPEPAPLIAWAATSLPEGHPVRDAVSRVAPAFGP